ncbi:MAG: hypothetical protein JWQ27_386 [Ferruginibacter sp.]|nr:hypothetical protein [Ferruginibacter sp.]
MQRIIGCNIGAGRQFGNSKKCLPMLLIKETKFYFLNQSGRRTERIDKMHERIHERFSQ